MSTPDMHIEIPVIDHFEPTKEDNTHSLLEKRDALEAVRNQLAAEIEPLGLHLARLLKLRDLELPGVDKEKLALEINRHEEQIAVPKDVLLDIEAILGLLRAAIRRNDTKQTLLNIQAPDFGSSD